MAVDGVQGVDLDGEEPKALVLSDGTRLRLDSEPAGQGRVEWRRARDGDAAADAPVSVPEALDLAGERYSRYVAVRTRAEAEWLHAVADWYRDQAERLSGELRVA